MDTSTDRPTREELTARAQKLVPLLQRNAEEGERLRRMPEETLDALTESGLLRMRVPVRYGGYESDHGTVADVLAELARGDGSASWTASVWAISSFVVGMFPDEVQDEVFADPGTRVCGILSPSAMGTSTAGGITLDGRWTFNSGATQSTWNTVAAVVPAGEGFQPVMTVVPTADLQVVDDWHTSGMRASGSVTTIAENLFVPQERVLPLGPALNQQYASVLNAGSPMYRSPFLPVACTTVGGTVLGLGRAAMDAFLDRLPGRKITYTDYADQAAAPLTHLQVADAATRLDQAGFHARRAADRIDGKARTGEAWTLLERAQARMDLGATTQRVREAVDVLHTASGASSIHSSVPMQRIHRDVEVLHLHAVMHPNTNLELFGRVLCGLEPNTQYI